MNKPEHCEQCGEAPGVFRTLDRCISCRRWICHKCDAGNDWRNRFTSEKGYACRKCVDAGLLASTQGYAGGVREAAEHFHKLTVPELTTIVDSAVRTLVEATKDNLLKIQDIVDSIAKAAESTHRAVDRAADTFPQIKAAVDSATRVVGRTDGLLRWIKAVAVLHLLVLVVVAAAVVWMCSARR
ncbi:MAG: hypothetical protein IT371_23555 [Deltaproteobacteria bacterium]|nr:hypothetical protein [Deltaproteobacteria bacterium]